MGIYLGALAQGLVAYLVMPIMARVLPPDLSSDIQVGPATFKVGNFTDASIMFIIVALTIFLRVSHQTIGNRIGTLS